jgi:hypothetical protein
VYCGWFGSQRHVLRAAEEAREATDLKNGATEITKETEKKTNSFSVLFVGSVAPF